MANTTQRKFMKIKDESSHMSSEEHDDNYWASQTQLMVDAENRLRRTCSVGNEKVVFGDVRRTSATINI